MADNESASPSTRERKRTSDHDRLVSSTQSSSIVGPDICDTHAASGSSTYRDIHYDGTGQMYNGNIIGGVHNTYCRDPVEDQYKTRLSGLLDELHGTLGWLDAPDPELDQRAARRLHEAGTCQWFLNSRAYVDWAQQDTFTVERVMWLHGKAGCCKTVLCSTVVDDMTRRLQDRSTTFLGYFFFTFREARKQSYQDFLASILARHLDGLMRQRAPEDIDGRELYLESLEPWKELRQAYTARHRHIYALEIATRALLSTRRSAFIVIDGLDESPLQNGNREEIMQGLKSLISACPSLRIFVTSRREPDIEDFMISLGTTIRTVKAEVVNRDIERYVQKQMEKHWNLRRLSNDLKAEIMRVLTSKAGGMFRWVFCVLDQIRRLRLLTAENVLHELHNLPESLDETYERILTNFDQGQQAKRALVWLVFCARPLTFRQLRDACIVDHEQAPHVRVSDRQAVELLIKDMSSLIQVEGAEHQPLSAERESEYHLDDRASLAHYSVKEYLLSSRIHGSGAKRFAMSIHSGSDLIAQSCVMYILHSAPRLWKDIKASRNTDRRPGGLTHFHHHRAGAARPLESGPPEQSDTTLPLLKEAIFWLSYLQDNELSPTSVSLRWDIFEDPMAFATWRAAVELFAPGSLLSIVLCVADDSEASDARAFVIACALGLQSITRAAVARMRSALTDNDRELALLAAARSGNLEATTFLLDMGVSPNSVRMCAFHKAHCVQQTALTAATRQNDTEIVRMLVENGADPDLADNIEGTALQIATKEGNATIVEVLLRAEADLDLTHQNRPTPLQIACETGSLTIVRLLLGAGADSNGVMGHYRGRMLSPLFIAVDNAHHSIATELLRTGAEPNVQGPLALHFLGHSRPLDLGSQRTVLGYAAENGWPGTVRMLLEAGADPNAHKGFALQRILQSTLSEEEVLSTIESLFSAGAKIDLIQPLLTRQLGVAHWLSSMFAQDMYMQTELEWDHGTEWPPEWTPSLYVRTNGSREPLMVTLEDYSVEEHKASAIGLMCMRVTDARGNLLVDMVQLAMFQKRCEDMKKPL